MPTITNSPLCWIWFNLIRFCQALLQITAEAAFWGIRPSQGGPRRGASGESEPHRLKEEILHRDRERRSKRAAHLPVPSERLKDWVGEQVNKGWEEERNRYSSSWSLSWRDRAGHSRSRTDSLAQWQSPAVPVKDSPSEQHLSTWAWIGSQAVLLSWTNTSLSWSTGTYTYRSNSKTEVKAASLKRGFTDFSRVLSFPLLLSY